MQSVLTVIGVLCIAYFIYAYRESLKVYLRVDYILIAYGMGMLIRWLLDGLMSEEALKGCLYISIPMAIPLLIVKADFQEWWRLAPQTVMVFFIACISTFMVGWCVGYFFAEGKTEKMMVAMLVGVYTGGTPNLNAVGLSLKVPPETLAATISIDLIASGLYLLFMLIVAPWLAEYWLPYPLQVKNSIKTLANSSGQGGNRALEVLRAMLFSVGVVGITIGIHSLFTIELHMGWMMLGITLFSVLGSFYRRFRLLRYAEPVGEYWIVVFCFATGLLIDISRLPQYLNSLLMFSICIIFGSMLMQLLIGKILRVNGYVVFVCSIASVMSPAFIPMFIKHYVKEELLLPGLTAGIAGFAIGTLLGLSVYALL